MKELGFEQESLNYWKSDTEQLIEDNGANHYKDLGCYYSAYTVAELGEMLPNGCEIVRNVEKNSGYYYRLPPTIKICKRRLSSGQFKTMANAMAKMLIYLKENNLI